MKFKWKTCDFISDRYTAKVGLYLLVVTEQAIDYTGYIGINDATIKHYNNIVTTIECKHNFEDLGAAELWCETRLIELYNETKKALET